MVAATRNSRSGRPGRRIGSQTLFRPTTYDRRGERASARRDHRRRQQGRYDVAVRLTVRAPGGRALRGQGDAVLHPGALRPADRVAGRLRGVLHRTRRASGPARGHPVLLLRRGTAGAADRRDAVQPAGHRRAARTGRPGDLVLPVPEDAPADPGGAVDRGLPRARRHAQPRRLPRPGQRAVLRGRRRLLRRLPPRVAGAVRSRPAAPAVVRGSDRGSGARAAGHRDVARPGPESAPGRIARRREQDDGVQEPEVPTRRARRERPLRALPAPAPGAEAPRAYALLPLQRPRRRRPRQ